ncbi:uncharacterized protein LOC111718378 [Eurytemora carolleeae]|uniref:uncharacterized protein LOC111718378 n=1 Tax=Eurytemora carolleeae TaxID=1294199 RepID=UPI000C7641B9|nr:uncharacterized protein LOC111718378 [Eurytemora carolleeae]|eukprot:XP_023349720.1 uncharacterized protein LOC111718378 [Eurytemora affinis]
MIFKIIPRRLYRSKYLQVGVTLCFLFFWASQLLYHSTKEYYSFRESIIINKSSLSTPPPSTPPPSTTTTAAPKLKDVVYDSEWIHVPLSNGKSVYQYSAYQDNRVGYPIVRIIGITQFKFKDKLDCIMEDEHGYRLSTEVDLRQNKEHWNLPWSSFFFNCRIEGNFIPKQVRLVLQGEEIQNGTNWTKVVSTHPIRINDAHALKRNLSGFSVCVKPLYNNHDRALWFLEFIEFYRLLGATHFFFYNHTVGPHVSSIIRHYQKKNVITLLPWNLPIESKTKIRNEGQFSAFNDCTYRSMYRFKYTAVVDVDEYLIPKQSLDIPTMLDKLDGKSTGSFIFRNAFFYLYWENDTSLVRPEEDSKYLITMFKTRRIVKLHNYGVRSKYVVKADDVIEVGNHNIWQHIPGRSALKVKEEFGLSHHYRICEFGGFACKENPSVIDTSTHRWSDKLFKAVKESCKLIFDNPACPNPPPLGNPW